jgi:hypothetical protein
VIDHAVGICRRIRIDIVVSLHGRAGVRRDGDREFDRIDL